MPRKPIWRCPFPKRRLPSVPRSDFPPHRRFREHRIFCRAGRILEPATQPRSPLRSARWTRPPRKKIDAVRSRLEELGAEYVRLEMSEDGRTFHCLCDMLLENSAGKTQPFEATRNDPVAAAEAVLENVEAWRKGTVSGPGDKWWTGGAAAVEWERGASPPRQPADQNAAHP